MIRKLSEKLKAFLHSDQFRELFVYLVVGVLTTLVNYGVYFGVTRGGALLFGIPADHLLLIPIAKIIAWIAAVVFAFWANKKYVFRSAEWEKSVLIRELLTFSAARILSLGIDMGFVEGAVYFFGMNDMLATLIANVIVMIANYFASKFWIFRKKKS